MHGARRALSAAVSAVLTAAMLPIAVVGAASPATALDNGEALTPPMGWNDWNSFGCDIDEQDVIDTIDLFVSTGLRDAGYEYINIDDCWAASTRDADGRLQADPVDFPHGIAYLADYAHANGLKLGIYSSAGSTTCQRVQPGSLGNEYIDALTFVEWGVDYLKYDNCGTQTGYEETQASYIARYSVMADAIAQVEAETGEKLVLSICEWGNFEPWTWADDLSNLWRTTFDIADNYPSMLGIFQANVVLDEYARPGAWNDPDMLQVGNGGMTDAEYRTHFSLWAMMAAPLLIGTDLREASDATMATFLNTDVIAIDQDPLGVQARLISDEDGLYVLAKPLSDGDVAVALFNSTGAAQKIATTIDAVGATEVEDAYVATDLWTKETVQTTGDIRAWVAPHETKILRIESSSSGWSDAAAATTLSLSSSTDPAAPTGTTLVTVRLDNDAATAVSQVNLSLTVPEGWSSQLFQSADGTVASGATTTAIFGVTAPATEVPVDEATFTATASYRHGGVSFTASSSYVQHLAAPVDAPYAVADVTGGRAVTGQIDTTFGINAGGSGVAPASSSFTGTTPASDSYAAIYLESSAGSTSSTQVTVESQSLALSSARAGIMVRDEMTAGGTPTGVALYVTGTGSVAMAYAADGGSAYTATYPSSRPGPGGGGGGGITVSGPVTLRLDRSGTSYTGWYSTDGGATFAQVGTEAVTLATAATVQDAGMFATSGSTASTNTALFTSFAALEVGPDEQLLQVTVPEITGPGEFIWSILGSNDLVDLGTAELQGDHWAASGAINPLRVTDTRTGGPAWSLSGQVSDFAGSGASFSGEFLGWTPLLIEAGGGAVAGGHVASSFDGGDGLAESSTLGHAEVDHPLGAALLGADLELKLPVDATDGTYRAVLTLTALS